MKQIESVLCCCAWSLSRVRLFVTPWTVAHKQEYWSGLPCPPPGDLPHLRIEPQSPALQVDSLSTEPSGKPPYGKGGGGGGLVAKSCLTLATPLTVAYQAPHPRHAPPAAVTWVVETPSVEWSVVCFCFPQSTLRISACKLPTKATQKENTH